MPSWPEILVILGIFLLFFGSSRLPKMARSLGSSLTEFKKGLRGEPDEDEKKNLPEKGSGSSDPGSPSSTDSGSTDSGADKPG